MQTVSEGPVSRLLGVGMEHIEVGGTEIWVQPGTASRSLSHSFSSQLPTLLPTPFPEAQALQKVEIKNDILACRCLPRVPRSCDGAGAMCVCAPGVEQEGRQLPVTASLGNYLEVPLRSISLSDSCMVMIVTFQTTPYSAHFSLFFKLSSLANYVIDNILGCYCFIIKIISLWRDP